jgi:hypothetical protein
MGGINHQPTSHVSNALTVPMSEALSQVGIGFLSANVWVEQAIKTEKGMSFGACKAHLGQAVVQLDATLLSLDSFVSYGRQILGVLRVGDYEPFAPATSLDLDSFLAELIDAGLVPDSAVSRQVVQTLADGGYTALFALYQSRAEGLASQIGVLRELTIGARDGEGGYQGLFWDAVESNRSPWRQAYALALTQFNELLVSFQTGALVSTETFLQGTKAPGLLTNVGEVTLAPEVVYATA